MDEQSSIKVQGLIAGDRKEYQEIFDSFYHSLCYMETGEGPQLAKKYNVTVYPTFLLLKSDGKLIDRVVGKTATGERFIQKNEIRFRRGFHGSFGFDL